MPGVIHVMLRQSSVAKWWYWGVPNARIKDAGVAKQDDEQRDGVQDADEDAPKNAIVDDAEDEVKNMYFLSKGG